MTPHKKPQKKQDVDAPTYIPEAAAVGAAAPNTPAAAAAGAGAAAAVVVAGAGAGVAPNEKPPAGAGAAAAAAAGLAAAEAPKEKPPVAAGAAAGAAGAGAADVPKLKPPPAAAGGLAAAPLAEKLNAIAAVVQCYSIVVLVVAGCLLRKLSRLLSATPTTEWHLVCPFYRVPGICANLVVRKNKNVRW